MTDRPPKCETCGAVHGHYGAVDRHGQWHDDDDIDGMNSGHGEALFGDYPETKLATICTTKAGEQLCKPCLLAKVRPGMPKQDATKRALRRGQTAMLLEG